MPHSYGADFSGVGLCGPRNRESTRAPAPKPAPSTIRRTTKSQLSMSATLVKLFASLASCYRIRLADASGVNGASKAGRAGREASRAVGRGGKIYSPLAPVTPPAPLALMRGAELRKLSIE